MKTQVFLFQACLFSHLACTLAFRGEAWKEKLTEIKARAAAPIDSVEDSNEMIGDLLSPGPISPVGQIIADIIVGKADGQATDTNYAVAGQLGSPECMQDSCCVWKYVSDEMAAKFKGDSGRCNLYARGAIRLGFHDAATWKKGMMSGGADGSMVLTDEISRDINRGLEEIVDQMRAWYQKYQPYGAGAADLIQMGATVATVVCPLGPRIRSFVGRQDSNQLPPDGLLPDVNATVDSIIQLFEDKTIKPHGLAALVGAHTTSQQRFFQPEKAFDPQDSTPGVWDVLFYGQTLSNNPPSRVVKFTSDISLSTHPRIQDEWQAFTDPNTGQDHWNDDFAKEYVRLSLLGVQNINQLTECTKVLPPLTGRTFMPPDSNQVNQWLMGGYSNYGSAFGQLLDGGRAVTSGSLSSNGINPADANNRQPPPPGSPYNRPPPAPAPVQNPPPRPAAPSHAPPRLSTTDALRSSTTQLPGQPTRGPPGSSTILSSDSLSTFSQSSFTSPSSSSSSSSSSSPRSSFSALPISSTIFTRSSTTFSSGRPTRASSNPSPTTQQTGTRTFLTTNTLSEPRGTRPTNGPRLSQTQISQSTVVIPGFSSTSRGGGGGGGGGGQEPNPVPPPRTLTTSRTRPQPTSLPQGAQTTPRQLPPPAPTTTARPSREPKGTSLPQPLPPTSRPPPSGPGQQPQPRPAQQSQPRPKTAQQPRPNGSKSQS